MTSSVLSTLLKSKTGRTPLIKPILTSLSNLALTVGVVIPVSLDICLKDFLPSFE
jgi:molybdopterin-guanine dinucleotide biosynthesis protein